MMMMMISAVTPWRTSLTPAHVHDRGRPTHCLRCNIGRVISALDKASNSPREAGPQPSGEGPDSEDFYLRPAVEVRHIFKKVDKSLSLRKEEDALEFWENLLVAVDRERVGPRDEDSDPCTPRCSVTVFWTRESLDRACGHIDPPVRTPCSDHVLKLPLDGACQSSALL